MTRTIIYIVGTLFKVALYVFFGACFIYGAITYNTHLVVCCGFMFLFNVVADGFLLLKKTIERYHHE